MKDQSQDFEQLRRLLALKRHEVPPPGYFADFSSRVIDRIECEGAPSNDGLLAGLFSLFKVRPAISASFCLASVLVLLAATTLFEKSPAGNSAKMPTIQSRFARSPEPAVLAPASATVFVTNLEPSNFALDMAPPVKPLPPRTNTLFGSPDYLRVEPVSFNR